MFQKFNEQTRLVLKRSKLEMQKLKHPFVSSEHLLLSILSNTDLEATKKLNEHGIFYDNFKQELISTIGYGDSKNNFFIYTPLLKRIIENSIIEASENNQEEVSVENLLLSLIDEGEGVAIRIITKMGINLDDIYLKLINKDENNNKLKGKKKLSIYEYGVDLCQKVEEEQIDPVFGRDKEINRLIEILSRKNKNNPLLIGNAGVGKTAIVEALALKIVKGEVPTSLLKKRIISLSMASLVAGTKYRGEFEDRINKIIKEIENNSNIIIFIDEMHSLVGAGGAEGAIDASNIIKPALARSKFKLIGATTTNEYKETIEKDKALDRRFQTILINEPTLQETKNILLKLKPIYENYHHVIVPDLIINTIVNLSNKYIHNRQNPDKSLDILDEVCASVSLIKDKNNKKIDLLQLKYQEITKNKNKYIIEHNFKEASILKESEIKIENKINNLILKSSKFITKEITKDDVSRIIKYKVNTPVYEIDKSDLKELKNLDKKLNEYIIGQKDAIDILCRETKKIKLGLKSSNRPLSFLFTGSTGVGKTALVKLYAQELKMNLIRLDMSEYKESHSTSKILGSPPGYIGYDDHNFILEKVKNNPNSIILLDEIEKANLSVINLFLQILDNGIINDSKGNSVYLNNCIIIMTSNITSNNKTIGFSNNQNIKQKLQEFLSLEFINRIDNIIYFNDLTKENVINIVNNRIKYVKKRFKEQEINLKISNKFIDEIVKLSEYQIYGARSINRLIDEKIDNIVIDNVLNGIKDIKINCI